MNLLREKLRVQGHHLAQMGGGGGSSSSSTTTSNADKRNSVNSGIGVSGDGNSINVLDGGVIKNSLDTVTATVGKSFDFATKSNAQALDSLNTTANLVKDAYADAKGRGALTDTILIGALVMAGVVAVVAMRNH